MEENKNDPKPTAYEAPEVERVLSADDLAREMHYAGIGPVPSLAPG